jgi:hypothetical protein
MRGPNRRRTPATPVFASAVSKTKAILMNQKIQGLSILAAGALALLLSSSGDVRAEPLTPGLSTPQWTAYVDDAGTRVDYPENIFPIDDGPAPRGIGRVLRASDGRALMMVYAEDNDERYSPAGFVRANFKGAREDLDYDRVTSRFFALSGAKGDLVFYSRCNFADGARGPAHCIYLAYPKDEARRWDRIVTRISLSLRPLR